MTAERVEEAKRLQWELEEVEESEKLLNKMSIQFIVKTLSGHSNDGNRADVHVSQQIAIRGRAGRFVVPKDFHSTVWTILKSHISFEKSRLKMAIDKV
jgi:hypothetical protein